MYTTTQVTPRHTVGLNTVALDRLYCSMSALIGTPRARLARSAATWRGVSLRCPPGMCALGVLAGVSVLSAACQRMLQRVDPRRQGGKLCLKLPYDSSAVGGCRHPCRRGGGKVGCQGLLDEHRKGRP